MIEFTKDFADWEDGFGEYKELSNDCDCQKSSLVHLGNNVWYNPSDYDDEA